MLWPPGLRAVHRKAWLEAFTTDCEKRVRITVTDRNFRPVGDPLVHVPELQTSIDTSAETDRRLDVTAIDNGGQLERSGLLLWHVVLRVRVDSLGLWVDSPLGVYVPNEITREGQTLTGILPDIEAVWAVQIAWNKFGPIGKGEPILKAARDLLFKLGVRSFRGFDVPATVPNGRGGRRLVRTTRRWEYGGQDVENRPVEVVRRMLRAHGYQFFFDGRGAATVRPLSARPLYDIDPFVLRGEEPRETTVWGSARSRSVVTSDGDKVMHGRFSLPKWHPASAEKRAFNNVPIEHILYTGSPSRSQKVLNEQARDRLWQQVNDTRSVTARTLPLPLDPEDRISVTADSGRVIAPVRQCSTLWISDDREPAGMDIGVTRRLVTARPRRRR